MPAFTYQAARDQVLKTAWVSAGRLTALLAGDCDIRGTLAVDGARALDGGTRVHLPGAVSMRPPVQLLADADYARAGTRTMPASEGDGDGSTDPDGTPR